MTLIDKIIRIIYPPKCIFCQKIIGIDVAVYICDNCYEKLPFSEKPFLPRLADDNVVYCDGALSVFEYTGMVKESLIRFKFYNKPSYYKTYARLMAEVLKKYVDIGNYNMLMSVPLHKDREIARGYNQAYLISRALSKELKLKECSNLMKRCRYTETQSLLDMHRRKQNVRGAFSVTSPQKVAGKSILLVDDILTTGATLEECGKTLKQAGAIKVTGLVVATGRK